MLKPCLNYVQTVYEPCLPWAMTWQDQLLYELCHCVHQPMPGTAVPFTKSFSLEWKIWKTLLWYTTVSYSIIPWPRIWYFIRCSRLLICLLNLFPFYGVTNFFLHKSPFSNHQIWPSDILDKTSEEEMPFGHNIYLGVSGPGWIWISGSGSQRI